MNRTSSTKCHIEDDSLKIIKQSYCQLLSRAAKNLSATWTAVEQVKTITIHVIERKITKTYTKFQGKTHFKHIELRSATIPVGLNDFACFEGLFELAAAFVVSTFQYFTWYNYKYP